MLPNKPKPNSSPIITTSEAVAYFSLVRYNSATHSTNNEQRRFEVSSTDLGNNQYQLSIPNNNIAIPGYYMLFAVNAAGTPSIAHALQIPMVPTTPIAAFSANPSTGFMPLPVSFDASASSDDEGITSYVWDFVMEIPEAEQRLPIRILHLVPILPNLP